MLSNLKWFKGGIDLKNVTRNSKMDTNRVLDTRGMEIRVCQLYSHFSPRNIYINTAHVPCLSHDTPSAKWQLHHFSDPCHNLLPRVWGNFFISDICNHQGTHIQKSAAYTDTTFNLIHYFNCTKIHHTKISAWRTWKKSIRTSCDGIKVKLCAPLGQWILYDHTWITSWQWFLSRDLCTLHYI